MKKPKTYRENEPQILASSTYDQENKGLGESYQIIDKANFISDRKPITPRE